MPEPYAIVGEVKRFSQRCTAFARAGWDSTSAAYGRQQSDRAEWTARGVPGYARHDFALAEGAWAVSRAWREQRDAGRAGGEPDEPAGRPGGDVDAGLLTRRVKRAARFFGAALAGVTRVDPLWVYASDGEERPIELPDGLDTAVVMAVEMDYGLIRTSPSAQAAAATGLGYSRMAFVAQSLARFLQGLGWCALPCGNDTALSIPLAVDAGLGELGRNGLLITRPFGPRVRLCKVFTDAPLVPDEPVSFGVREFCDACLLCADACPSGSIPRGDMTTEGPTPSNSPGVLKWRVDPDTCLAFWRANGTCCSNCIRSCPFNKPSGKAHDAARALVGLRSRVVDRLLVRLDGALDYGRRRPPA
jgi:reductive dehalogenase